MILEKKDPKEAAEQKRKRLADPKIRAWLRRAKKLFDAQPEGIWIYFDNGNFSAMAEGPNGERYMTDFGSTDPEARVAGFQIRKSDAGDW
ncbi:MAG: hypothetical protein IPK82_23255 [Polyangiaceae bacterium]|nr:hypothetical protein [Polyangiaceae bacterium]